MGDELRLGRWRILEVSYRPCRNSVTGSNIVTADTSTGRGPTASAKLLFRHQGERRRKNRAALVVGKVTE